MDVNERKRKSFSLGLMAMVLVVATLIGAAGGSVLLPRLSALAATSAPGAVGVVSAITNGAVRSPSTASPSRMATATVDSSQMAEPNSVMTAASAPTVTAAATAPGNQPYVAVVRKVG